MTMSEATELLAGTRDASRASVVRASERLWNLQWPTWQLGEIIISPGTLDEALPFVSAHYAKIFPSQPGRWFEEKMTAAKRRFLEESDVLLFREEGRIVGLYLAHPTDWSTLYVRTLAMLPTSRGRGIMEKFLPVMNATLASAGVERIEADTAPTNLVLNRALLSNGWMVTGTSNSERWGSTLRYTKFLGAEAERIFKNQFLVVAAASGRDHSS